MSVPRSLLIGLAGFVVTAAAILLESCIVGGGPFAGGECNADG